MHNNYCANKTDVRYVYTVSCTRRVSEGTGEVYTEIGNTLYDSKPADSPAQEQQPRKGSKHPNELRQSNSAPEDDYYDVPNQQYETSAQANSNGGYANVQ